MAVAALLVSLISLRPMTGYGMAQCGVHGNIRCGRLTGAVMQGGLSRLRTPLRETRQAGEVVDFYFSLRLSGLTNNRKTLCLDFCVKAGMRWPGISAEV